MQMQSIRSARAVGFARKTLCAMAAIATLAGAPALAADMPVKAPPLPAPAVCTWCGWYIGINAGWVGSARNTITNTGTDTDGAGLGSALAAGALPAFVVDRYSGFLGGGQIGYNWQQDNFIFGLEADFDGVSANASSTVIFPGSLAFVPNTSTYTRRLDWLSTVRGRLGMTMSPAFLLYATGGAAFGETKIGNSESCPLAAPPCSSEATMNNTTSHVSTGWTAGAGAEWMFAPHWSLKAEYLYADLGRHSSTIVYTYGVASTSSMTSSVRDAVNIVRGGINWHF